MDSPDRQLQKFYKAEFLGIKPKLFFLATHAETELAGTMYRDLSEVCTFLGRLVEQQKYRARKQNSVVVSRNGAKASVS